MAGFETTNTDFLIRQQIWAETLKEVFEDNLIAKQYVDWIDFPDGEEMNIPSVGQFEAADYKEGEPVKYTSVDTGNFKLRVTEYIQSGTYVTNKMRQDSYVMDRIMSTMPNRLIYPIEKRMEVDILSVVNSGQTAGDVNAINGAAHRFVGGLGGTPGRITPADFAAVRLAFERANVPARNWIAIVDPSVEFDLNTLTNIVNVSNNPRWEGIIDTSIAPTGMKFLVNIYGFDVYVSQNLPQGINEIITTQVGSPSVNNGVANLFMCVDPMAQPIVGAVRQEPRLDAEYNKDLQREEYVVTARWGFGFYRPESAVTVLTERHSANIIA